MDNCQFIISTHIVEAGEMLRDNGNMQFLYLPTRLEHNRPVYTYKIEQGISGDRHGMRIIRNERIVETIMNTAGMESFPTHKSVKNREENNAKTGPGDKQGIIQPRR